MNKGENLNINDLKLFKSICKTRNYTQTSKLFFISQPAVTAAVNRMEQEMSTTLFKRNRFKQDVTLTQTGKLFENHVDQILKQLAEAIAEIQTFEHLQPINFGLPPMIGAYYFPSVIPKLVHANVLSMLRITEDDSQRMLNQLVSAKIDIALVGSLDKNFSHEGLESIRLTSYPFKLIVSPKNPLAALHQVNFEQVKNMPFVSMKSEFLHHRFLLRLFKRHQAEPKIISQTSQIQTYKSLVATDAGIGLIAELAVNIKKDGVVPLNFSEPKLPDFNIFLCYPKDQTFSDIKRKVIELLKQPPRTGVNIK